MQLLRELTHLSHDEDVASIPYGFVLTDEQQFVEVGALRLKDSEWRWEKANGTSGN